MTFRLRNRKCHTLIITNSEVHWCMNEWMNEWMNEYTGCTRWLTQWVSILGILSILVILYTIYVPLLTRRIITSSAPQEHNPCPPEESSKRSRWNVQGASICPVFTLDLSFRWLLIKVMCERDLRLGVFKFSNFLLTTFALHNQRSVENSLKKII